MDKSDQMIEMITQDVIAYIVEDTAEEFDTAMEKFYCSQTFEKLQDKETGLYREGSAYIYDLYKIERAHGTLVQLEI